MAQTRVNGAPASMEVVGRDLFFKTFTGNTNITTTHLQALVEQVELTSTITVIGSFTSAASNVVNMVIEGDDVTSNITVTGCAFVTTTMSF